MLHGKTFCSNIWVSWFSSNVVLRYLPIYLSFRFTSLAMMNVPVATKFPRKSRKKSNHSSNFKSNIDFVLLYSNWWSIQNVNQGNIGVSGNSDIWSNVLLFSIIGFPSTLNHEAKSTLMWALFVSSNHPKNLAQHTRRISHSSKCCAGSVGVFDNRTTPLF